MTNHGCMSMTLKPKPNHTNGKRFATIEEIKEKSNQQLLLAIPKKRVSEMFRGLGGYSEGDKIVIDK